MDHNEQENSVTAGEACIVAALALRFIPMLVFTALPNIFFGYDSSTTPDIVDFTASAHGLEAVYQSIEQKNQSVIDRLVESIPPNFVTEDGPVDKVAVF